jgi:hypothetical protein
MTDWALALIGGVAKDGASGAAATPNTLPSANNNPAVLNKPTRKASRLDIDKLRFMPIVLKE